VKEPSIINLASLKDQVYEYLRNQIKIGELRPGSHINIEETSKQLGVSRTPLKDALLQLEMEGFVTILPRKGVLVRQLTIEDIKEYYEIIGALESTAFLSGYDKINATIVQKMKNLNSEMIEAIGANNFTLYFQKNLEYHDIFLGLCKNKNLAKITDNLKRRLYHFPRREGYLKQWEESSIREHVELTRLIEEGKKEEAAAFIRDVHWSFKIQEKFLKKLFQKQEGYVPLVEKSGESRE